MKRVHAALVAVAVLSLSAPASAQTGRVVGVVIDQSGKTIKGATIRAVNREAVLSDLTSTTDGKGRFGMIGLRAGVWTFTAEAPGFEPVVGTAPIRAATLGPPLRFVLPRLPEVIPGALTRDIAAQVTAANALKAQGRLDQALTAYEAIRTRNPKVTSLHVVIADTLRQQAEGEPDEARRRALYTRAVAAYVEAARDENASERVRLDLGLAQMSAGLREDGVRTLEALAASTPESDAGRDAATRLAELQR